MISREKPRRRRRDILIAALLDPRLTPLSQRHHDPRKHRQRDGPDLQSQHLVPLHPDQGIPARDAEGQEGTHRDGRVDGEFRRRGRAGGLLLHESRGVVSQ